MSVASFVIAPIKEGGWAVSHASDTAGPYLTREAAFEAAIGPASNAIKNGDEVRIVVKAPVSGPALGAE